MDNCIHVATNPGFIGKPVSHIKKKNMSDEEANSRYYEIADANKIYVGGSNPPMLGEIGDGNWQKINLAKNFVDVSGITTEEYFKMVAIDGFSSCSVFKNESRSDKNFVKSNIALVDIDKGHTLESIKDEEFFQEHCTGFYTTPSHTADAHRFRLVFRLERIITERLEMRAIYNALIKIFGGDESCKDASRIFYGSINSIYNIYAAEFIQNDIINELIKMGTPPPYIKKPTVIYSDKKRGELLEKLKDTVISDYHIWWKMICSLLSNGYTEDDIYYISCNNSNHDSESFAGKTVETIKPQIFSTQNYIRNNPGFDLDYCWNLVNKRKNKYDAIRKFSKPNPFSQNKGEKI